MTIFLTTQYLEEADELADRVGIVNDGRLVAQGTPNELKRSVGNDVIVARLDGSARGACRAVYCPAYAASRRTATSQSSRRSTGRRQSGRLPSPSAR